MHGLFLFQPTLPARGATPAVLRGVGPHAFQPTLPARGATAGACAIVRRILYFNPRSPHGERRGYPHHALQGLYISTHAPRTGSDTSSRAVHSFPPISTHAPRTGSDLHVADALLDGIISTHAPRTGSDIFAPNLCNLHRISTHAPRTGSDLHVADALLDGIISTHAPRTGSDFWNFCAYIYSS